MSFFFLGDKKRKVGQYLDPYSHSNKPITDTFNNHHLTKDVVLPHGFAKHPQYIVVTAYDSKSKKIQLKAGYSVYDDSVSAKTVCVFLEFPYDPKLTCIGN